MISSFCPAGCDTLYIPVSELLFHAVSVAVMHENVPCSSIFVPSRVYTLQNSRVFFIGGC